MAERFIVRGTITDTRQQPIVGITVRAFDKDLPSLNRDELLGEAVTDAEGRYTVTFTEERFRRNERARADVYIVVVDREGAIVGQSPAYFNPEAELDIDLQIASTTVGRLSEYEQLTGLLQPLVVPSSLADLTADDLDFLTNDTRGDRRRVAWLSASARLSAETGVPTEAFYGWARKEVPREWAKVPDVRDAKALAELLRAILTRFRATAPDTLRQALVAAIAEWIIPARLRDVIDTILRDLVRSALQTHEAVGRLRDADAGAPLVNTSVRLVDIESEPDAELGTTQTGGEGLFLIRFGTAPYAPEGTTRALRFEVLDVDGAVAWATEIRVPIDQRDVLDIRVPLLSTTEPPAHALDAISTAAQIDLPPDLLPFLAGRNIRTLRELRRSGGLSRLEGLPIDPGHPAAQVLEAHADLARISPDVMINSALIDRGFRNVADIAATPLPDFVNATHEAVGEFRAATLQVSARAQTAFLRNVLTGLAVDRANGFTTTSGAGTTADPLPERCGCDDCEAAVSPAAYLADLIAYSVTHLKASGAATDLAFLENTFHQPFGELPTDCEAVEETFRQVRICIEVLRAYLAAHPPSTSAADVLEAATSTYLLTAYTALLARFGTSYDEIRLARGASADERRTVADRIGIELTEPRPDPLTTAGDELDQLFLDPDAPATDDRALTERALERLFGLVDTTRNPLSSGLTIGDNAASPEITRWRIAGAIWSLTTDGDGLVYLRVKNTVTTGTDSEVEVYRDSARTALVAAGTANAVSGPRRVKITPRNGSGISGAIAVAGASADNTSIAVALIPKLLAWRLRHLRTIWHSQDFPLDIYSSAYRPEADRRPIVDPDLIGPDDFRRPDVAEAPFALWRRRRIWVDQQLQDLLGITKTVVTDGVSTTVPDVDKVFTRMFATVTYGTDSIAPWLAATPAAQFDTILKTLESGTGADVAAATTRVATDLNLSTETFGQLVRTCAKQRAWEGDPKSEPVPTDEWDDFFSILVRAQTDRFLEVWRQEEIAGGIRFGFEDFWHSEREPRDGVWPPVPLAGHPLIDPDEVKLVDLPEPTIGADAIALWQTRRDALTAETKALENERETNGFDAMMRRALGHPAPGNPLQHDLATLKTDLTSNNPAVVAAATIKVTNDLHLTLDGFNRVMTMKEQSAPASPRKPTDAEWSELYALLTTAHKLKHLYPAWTTAEGAAGFSTAYWRALKARLPRLRATVEQRQAWRRALDVRCRRPIVDPDIVATAWFNALGAAPADTLWQTRKMWIDDRIDDMESAGTTLAGFDTIVGDTLDISIAALTALDDRRRKGEAIQARLDQLPLDNPAFGSLLKTRALLAGGQPVTPAEWASAYSILVEVMKRRQSAEWREEEDAAGISLSPDFFVSPAVLPAPSAPSPASWRVSQADRFDWLDTLQSRIDQERSLFVSFHDVVSTVEESVLPSLRDALADAAGVGANLDARASWLTDRLLIDVKSGGCQRTTRIAQAIETLQSLLFAARTTQSAVLQTLVLTLVAPDFDQEWPWIGSYGTWRSAMFVFMYPENVCVPTLRRRQSPAFRNIVKAIRGSRHLTNQQACQLAADYAAYYEDVARMSLGASAQALVIERSGNACIPGVVSKAPLVLMFGKGGVTSRLYWSAYKTTDKTEWAQGFWDVVPGAPLTATIVGAAVYERYPTDRRIFVFIRTQEHKLQFLTFDLESRVWSGPIDLALPSGDAKSFDIAVDQNNFFYYYQPRLAIRVGSTFYFRPMNAEGTNWQDGDWSWYQLDNNALNLGGVTQLFAVTDGMMWVREGGQIEERYTAGLWSATSLNPINKDAEYLGAIYWGKAKNGWYRWMLQKRTDGVITEENFQSGSPKVSDRFQLPGLKFVAPNSGWVDHASYIYERRYVQRTGRSFGKSDRVWVFEPEGLYLRLVELEATLTNAPIRSATYRIAPTVIPSAVGQFSIPARLDGAAADVRRQTVKIVLTSGDAGVNRVLAEEAYYFVPIALADALRTSGEYVSALDWVRTVYDYSSPSGTQKIYYGLIAEESLPALYDRADDWLRDPLDPHAIAATRQLTYTRFTLLLTARILLDFANDEYTRDTSETVPRARSLYLTLLAVLSLPELHQQFGQCEDVVGEIDIALGADAPVSAQVQVGVMTGELLELDNVGVLKDAAVKVKAALGAEASWDERLARARSVVDAALATTKPSPTVAESLTARTTADRVAQSAVLTSPLVDVSAARIGATAAAVFQNRVALSAGVTPEALEKGTVSMPWLRSGPVRAMSKPTNLVLTPDLRPVAPAGSAGFAGFVRPDDRIYVDPDLHVYDPKPKPPSPAPPPVPVPPVIAPSITFCIPPNPLVAALRLQAELNLHKLRTCRNIAGMKRELDPYVAPIDTVTGLPTIGANGQLMLPGTTVLRPTIYRLPVLMQRAKDLVQIAQQMEAAMLAAIEKRDAEAYSLMRARQDLDLAQADVQLETLRLKQANDSVTLASLQQTRAQIQLDHFQKLLDEDLLEQERIAIEDLGEAAIFQATAADLSFAAAAVYGAAAVAGAIAGGAAGSVVGGPLGTALGSTGGAIAGALSGGLGGVASGLSALSSGYTSLAAKRSTRAQIQLTLASFERRRQEWELNAAVAKQDVAIGAQQVTIANDGVEIVRQEKVIAETRHSQAKDTVTFLANKFTNVELYDWMSGVLEGVYGFFLQQATAAAKVAETQTAFLRQEPPLAFIQGDYWQAPDGSLPADNLQGPAVDRRGLTGSARLLQDLYRLDQYAFDTDKRKMQLTKTFSLALLAPTEMQRFRDTGVLTFATPLQLFDADFPGHYLRLIKSVRTSVIALIPPVHGIRATLSSTGLSRVVIGPDIFQTVSIRRDPEQVALTSPLNATGVFDLEVQASGMLMPFEGSGVDTVWELKMPKAANQLDYRAVADVLFSVDFTSLPSWDYQQQVVQSLRQSSSGERPFSFRNQLSDQWYDLHNPEQSATPMVVRWRTVAEDFPPNIDAIKIQHVVLYFARKRGGGFEIPIQRLRFTDEATRGTSGGAATTLDGVVSTRRGNAGTWMSLVGQPPFGEWELALPNTEEMRRRFATEEIEDVLFVITYSGRTPEWPA
jgi:hypothetical protein